MIRAKIKVVSVKKYEETRRSVVEVHDACFDFVSLPRVGDWVDLAGDIFELQRLIHVGSSALDRPRNEDQDGHYSLFLIVRPLPVGKRMY